MSASNDDFSREPSMSTDPEDDDMDFEVSDVGLQQ